MKTLSLLALVALVAGCHFDKLFSGSGGTPLSHHPPAGLAFAPGPGNVREGQPLGPVWVSVVDSSGTPVAGADTILVTVAINNNPGPGQLSGTDTAHAANGVAKFTDLRIDKAGDGYTLIASAGALPPKVSAPFNVMPPLPTTGSILVKTTTSGATPDPDGYSVAVDGGTGRAIGNSDSVTFTGLTPASHAVELTGWAPNCTPSGSTSRNVSVTVGDTTRVAFSVSCPTPPPTTGSVKVTTSTTGGSPDPDGYTVTVNGSSQHIGSTDPNGVTFINLSVGNHDVVLSGVAPNCTVGGGNTQTANVTAGNTATAAFDIDCPTPPPTTGSLAVTTTTSGGGTDPDGYTVQVDGVGGTTKSIGLAQTVQFDNLSVGSHTATLLGLASNCSVSGGASKPVNITAGGLTTVTFDVTCTAPPNQPPSVTAGGDQQVLIGALFTLTGASFTDPDNGPWTVTINWGDGSQNTTFQMASGGAINSDHSYPITLLGQDYTLTVTVEDALGANRSGSKTVRAQL